jgi:hypothetical protein
MYCGRILIVLNFKERSSVIENSSLFLPLFPRVALFLLTRKSKFFVSGITTAKVGWFGRKNNK